MTQNLAQEAQLKSYQKRLKDDINSIVENYTKILQMVRTDADTPVSGSETQATSYEMCCRAANMCRAAESMLKLIWDIKQFLIINDFPLINDSISKKVADNMINVADIDHKLINLRDEIANELYELEDEYYNSLIK
ncbi:mediator of RNA polymerase II transcription subunit 22-like [Oppia nitens]|uniref:mediator of RNA polymerase II transcription subunit 22-like n=1 Tax=Oppia nitens TaxID=1686743 RepID=UPI0023DBFB06|nr:mediator of RNA polymerase II transcription subunit 22-like [Oppia nitens]